MINLWSTTDQSVFTALANLLPRHIPEMLWALKEQCLKVRALDCITYSVPVLGHRPLPITENAERLIRLRCKVFDVSVYVDKMW